MKNNNLFKIVLFCMLFVLPYNAMADDIDDGNGNGDVQDIPAAPINDYITLGLVGAIGIGIVGIRKTAAKMDT